MKCLLIGMAGSGGEEVYVNDLATHPPPGIDYMTVSEFHESAPGARALTVREALFNRLAMPFLPGLLGLRAYSTTGFDLVHVHNYPHHLRSEKRVPVVMTLGGGSYRHYLREYERQSEATIEALYRRADRFYRLFGITSEMANWRKLAGMAVFSEFAASFLLRAGVPKERIHVVPPGFSVPTVVRASGARPFTFLFVGRDPIRKGADLFIEAVQALRAQGHEVEAIMVGNESYPGLRREDGFEGHSWIGRKDLYESVYPRCDAYVCPSRAEGYGFTVLEAMSHGLPVVVSRRDAFPEIVTEGETGFLVDPESVDALAKAMVTLATEREGSRQMGTSGRRTFEARFTREHFHKRLSAFYYTCFRS